MKYLSILLLELVIGFKLYAGDHNFPAGARSSSLSTASVSLTDNWSSFNNQGGLAWVPQSSFGFYYENRFLVKEFAILAGAIVMPFNPGTASLNYTYFGYSKYHEMRVGLAFARKLSNNFSAGVQINYHSDYLAESLDKTKALSVELGIIYKPMENLFVGVHVFNPNRSKLSRTPTEYLPTIYRVGLGYYIQEKITILVETEKNIEYKPVFKGGIEITSQKRMACRAGMSSGEIEYSLGIGYTVNRLTLDLAFNHHAILGISPQVSFTYNLGKKHE